MQSGRESAVSTAEHEQRILHEIECRLRHEDRFIAARFAVLPIRAAMHRRTVRVFLAVEMALLILAAFGALAGSEALFVPAIGLAVVEPLIAIATRNGGRKDSGS
jgi:hypothetical protein